MKTTNSVILSKAKNLIQSMSYRPFTLLRVTLQGLLQEPLFTVLHCFTSLQDEALYVSIFSMKPIKYMRHARNRMRWHRITEVEVESALQNPEFLEPSVEQRLNAWIKTSDKFLRVTYKDETDRFLVITAVKKKKGWR
jgi:hypothetical protein